MKFMCSICREVFTGRHEDIIYTTKCGHIFHHHCIMQSIEHSKRCPYCRTNVNRNGIFKLNFCYDDGLTERQIETTRCEEMNVRFELALVRKELEDIKSRSKLAIETNQALRSEVRMHEDNARVHETVVDDLQQEITNLKNQLKEKTRELLRSERSDHRSEEVINLDDMNDPEISEIMEDIEYARSQARRPNNHIEVVNLDDSSSESNNDLKEKIRDLENQLELKNAMLSSALIQIEELERKISQREQNVVDLIEL